MRQPAPPPTIEELWEPGDELVADVRHALALAPRDTPQARFEAWAWRALLDELGPSLLTRHAAPSHLTASAVVLSPDASRTCLVLHHRIRRWVQPGGHLAPEDASLAAAAQRETEEETGLTGDADPAPLELSRHRAPCQPGVVDWHLDVQHLLIAEPRPPRVSTESTAVAWFPVGELPTPLAPGVRRTVRLAVRRYSRMSR